MPRPTNLRAQADKSGQRVIRLPKKLPWAKRAAEKLRDPDVRFMVIVIGRRGGKTTWASDHVGCESLEHRGNYLWGAPTHKISSIGRRRFRRYFKNGIRKARWSAPASATMVSGSRVMWASFQKDSGAIGEGLKCAVIEEAARVKKQIIYEDLFPTVMDTGGRFIAITTPRGKRNWVWEWYLRALAGKKHYAYVHGPSTENPSPFIREFVEIARENMPERLFRQEILAEFVEGEGEVFLYIRDNARLPFWLVAPQSPDHRYAIGLDLGRRRDYTVLTAIRLDTGGVEGMQRFHQLDWEQIVNRIVEFWRTWNRGTVVMESNGIGDPIFDALLGRGMPCEAVQVNRISKRDMVIAFATAMDRRLVSYPPDDVLLGELESFSAEVLPSGWVRYAAPEGMTDDIVSSLYLGWWGRIRLSSTGGASTPELGLYRGNLSPFERQDESDADLRSRVLHDRLVSEDGRELVGGGRRRLFD